MHNLNLPLPNVAPEDIFEECVNGYRDAAKRQMLMNYQHRIQQDSECYSRTISKSSEPPVFSPTPSEDGKKLAMLYDQKFARSKSPGRKYYDSIIKQAPFGICPICGISQATTLDHYLPKSKYPTLSVTPANLIPACLDCNKKKGDRSSLPVHLYLDSIPDDKWLHVKLDDDMTPLYFVSCPNSWDEWLVQRIETHFAVYKLDTLYAAHAAQEIAGKTRLWRHSFEQSPASLQDAIEHELFGYESIDKNSWKSALYRSLQTHMEIVVEYFKRSSTTTTTGKNAPPF